jgi:tetratricopeptide (TPR) repeat protein/SAM-dependent methyltransferase
MNRQQRRAARRSGGKSPSGAVPQGGAVAGLFNEALAHHQTGNIAEAERCYRQILSQSPAHADSLHNLGVIALQRSETAAAVELIGKAIAVNDQAADYHYNLALGLRTLNRGDDVVAHLQRAIALRPDYALAHLNLGNVWREQGRPADAVACYERVIALNPNSAAAHFNLANILAEQNRLDDAIGHYKQALAQNPAQAEAHAALGAALAAQDNAGAAVLHYEQALALRPDMSGVHEALSSAYLASGKLGLAVQAAARAVERRDTDENRLAFARCVRLVRLTADDPALRRLLVRALRENWARPRDLSPASISAIRLNGAVAELMARVNAAWPARLPAGELIAACRALSQDELLCRFLEHDLLADLDLERVFTNVRHAMLASRDAEAEPGLLPFYCAVARQCFINQYIFAMTNAEAGEAQKLRDALQQALATGEPYSTLWPVIVGAYFPLYRLANSAALLERTLSERTWPPSVHDVIAQQVAEPMEERRIAATMPALTSIHGEVSQAVREQYEENPYPRWVKAGPPFAPPIVSETQSPYRDVLIAGCGTGLSPVELARQARDARILAVDLSLASLSYAERMAQNLGVANVEFAQADISQLGSIGRDFDFIDVSGVLHHMADPWQGFRVLLSLLRPGGLMQVGLYSELARQNVVAARALIAARGYRPTPDGIRRCRQEIIASEDPLVRSVTAWADFFSADECRDLLFHVQEHRIDLREIAAFLAANGVSFAGFILDATTLQRFAERFPDRASMLDLDCWRRFETEAPNTFSGMYIFLVRKP